MEHRDPGRAGIISVSDKRMAELIRYIEQGDLMKFYKSREWRELRKVAIRRDNHECQHCKSKALVTTRKTINRFGKPTKMEVNHIKPVKSHPHLALTLDNLEYLCIDCHNVADGKVEMIIKKPKFMNEERW